MILILFIDFLHISFSLSNFLLELSNDIKKTLCILFLRLFRYNILFLISFLGLNLFFQCSNRCIKTILLFYHLFILFFILFIYSFTLLIILLDLFIHFIIIVKLLLKGFDDLFLSPLLFLDNCFLHVFCIF
jgi:hypothetical protein